MKMYLQQITTFISFYLVLRICFVLPSVIFRLENLFFSFCLAIQRNFFCVCCFVSEMGIFNTQKCFPHHLVWKMGCLHGIFSLVWLLFFFVYSFLLGFGFRRISFLSFFFSSAVIRSNICLCICDDFPILCLPRVGKTTLFRTQRQNVYHPPFMSSNFLSFLFAGEENTFSAN